MTQPSDPNTDPDQLNPSFSISWKSLPPHPERSSHKKTPQLRGFRGRSDETIISPSEAGLRSRRNRHSHFRVLERRESKALFAAKA